MDRAFLTSLIFRYVPGILLGINDFGYSFNRLGTFVGTNFLRVCTGFIRMYVYYTIQYIHIHIYNIYVCILYSICMFEHSLVQDSHKLRTDVL